MRRIFVIALFLAITGFAGHPTTASGTHDERAAEQPRGGSQPSTHQTVAGAPNATAGQPVDVNTTDASAAAFVVTSPADSPDAINGDGLCADVSGNCTLRAAITESNWRSGDNRIEFNLPGTAPVRIQFNGSPMSVIQDQTGTLTIDGYTQLGSRANTAAVGSNAVPGVELRGTANNPTTVALRITSAGNMVRGLLINNFYRGVVLDGGNAHHNWVVGNHIGYTIAGAAQTYLGHSGVMLDAGAHDNHIGAPSLADRNVVRGKKGIYLYGPGTDNNKVQNNLLCMTPNGMKSTPCSTGIDTDFGPKNNLYGGARPNERNYIGGTLLDGIEISHGWDPSGVDTTTTWQNNGNQVIGNWIGYRIDGAYRPKFLSGQNPPNSNDANGVNVYDGSNFNVVEGNWIASAWDGIQIMSPNSTGNIIRNNVIGLSPLGEPAPLGRYGIVVRQRSVSHVIQGNQISNAGVYGIGLTQQDVRFVRVSRNVITDMSGPAIYLAPDPQNAGRGANNMLAAPVITSVSTSVASGTGQPGATVEVYRASGSVGQSGLPIEYQGSVTVAANGNWSLSVALPAGEWATALQIAPNNNTSMLSTNVVVGATAASTAITGR